MIEAVGVTGVVDIVLDVRFFDDEFVRFDGELLNGGGVARPKRRDRQPGLRGVDRAARGADQRRVRRVKSAQSGSLYGCLA